MLSVDSKKKSSLATMVGSRGPRTLVNSWSCIRADIDRRNYVGSGFRLSVLDAYAMGRRGFLETRICCIMGFGKIRILAPFDVCPCKGALV